MTRALAAGASVILLASVVFFFYLGLYDPVRLASFDPYYVNRYRTWLFVCLIGVGIFIYCGVSFLLSWMPHSWGTSWPGMPLPQFLAGWAALIGSWTVVEGFTKLAAKFRKLEAENKALEAENKALRR